jgi:hypothetical protein
VRQRQYDPLAIDGVGIRRNATMRSSPSSAAFILALVAAAPATAQSRYPFQDPALDLEKRIDNVLSLMTLDERTPRARAPSWCC